MLCAVIAVLRDMHVIFVIGRIKPEEFGDLQAQLIYKQSPTAVPCSVAEAGGILAPC